MRAASLRVRISRIARADRLWFCKPLCARASEAVSLLVPFGRLHFAKRFAVPGCRDPAREAAAPPRAEDYLSAFGAAGARCIEAAARLLRTCARLDSSARCSASQDCRGRACRGRGRGAHRGATRLRSRDPHSAGAVRVVPVRTTGKNSFSRARVRRSPGQRGRVGAPRLLPKVVIHGSCCTESAAFLAFVATPDRSA